MAIEYRRRPPLTNKVVGDLLAPDTYPDKRRDYQNLLNHSLTWIGAFHDDKLVGYAHVAWDGGVHAFLLDPTVSEEYRRQGIGTGLVKEALAATAEYKGVEWVHVDASEELMERFYIPAGFRPTAAGLIRINDIPNGRLPEEG